jgi:hypothetical protein
LTKETYSSKTPNPSWIIQQTRDGRPNITVDKSGHPEKSWFGIAATPHGIPIDVNEFQPLNELWSIDESLDRSSNVTLDRAPQPAKQLASIVTTGAGRQIDTNDPHNANADCSIAQTCDALST